MELKQRRNANKLDFKFGEDELKYTLQDGSGTRSFSVPYTEISSDRQTLEERNQWLGNVGLLWIAIGAVLTVVNLMGAGSKTPSLWLFIGLGCYAAYWFRRTKFTILPSEKGNVLVIDDKDGPQVLKEIESRRAAQFRREYDFMPEGDSPQQHRNRFKWLHREGALSDEELQDRLSAIELQEPSVLEQGDAGETRVLN